MKNLKKLGKVLSTKEQKNVNGGFVDPECESLNGPGWPLYYQCGSLCCLIDPVLHKI